MICAACAKAADSTATRRPSHKRCKGGTWCDCQHMPARFTTLKIIKSDEGVPYLEGSTPYVATSPPNADHLVTTLLKNVQELE